MKYVTLFLSFLILLPACSVQGPLGKSSPPENESGSVHISLAGNAWVLDDPMASSTLIRETGLTNWLDPAHSVGVFFHLAGTGKLQLSVRARVPAGESVLKCTFGGETREITLRNTGWEDIPVGTFEVGQPGYQRLELQGESRTGPDFAEVEEVVLEGEAARGQVHYVKDEFYWGRRGPSVHFWFPQADKVEQVEWFYSEITVPEGQDVLGSYFMANGFGEGYFGFQVNSDTERRILFSVWSPFETDDPNNIPEDQKIKLLKKGPDVYTGEFGNEGSGGQSYLRFPWRAGVTYRFLLRGHPSGGKNTDYTAWFYAPEAGQWMLIAGWRRPQTNTYLTGLYSFLENFIPETGVISRHARYGNQWICDTRGQWHELTRVRLTADATAQKGNRLDYAGGLEDGAFFLRNCGFFNERTEMDTELQRPSTGKRPEVDLEALP
ncbi:MAG: DUF3472 domain-containing protein [Lewinellaceae bacterium]|nr:DUF3472 domain-containing protein [Lewinellaceae bacterium]